MQEKKIDPEETLLSQLLFKFLPYWPLFLLSVILSIAGAYVYLRYTTPKFEATATLIIKDEKKGADDSKAIESLDVISSKKIIENEVEVMQSRTIIDTVVKALHLYAPVFMKGKVRDISAYVISPVVIKAQNPDELKGSNTVSLSYNKEDATVLVNKSKSYPLNTWVETPYGTLRFELNERYKAPEEVKPYYFFLVPPKVVAGILLGNLSVSPSSKLSTIVYVKYLDEVPKRGEDILNELIKSYSTAGINDKSNLAQNTLAFVEERLKIVGRNLDSIERKIQRYKSSKGAVNIGAQGQLFLQNVSTNDQKLSDLNMQLAVLDQVDKSVTSGNNGAIAPSTFGVSDPALSQLLDKLYVLELQHEKLKSTVAENNSLMVSVTDQLNRIRPNILENIQSQRRSLLASKSNLSSTNSRYNSMLQTIPGQERELLEISREQSIKSAIYSFNQLKFYRRFKHLKFYPERV